MIDPTLRIARLERQLALFRWIVAASVVCAVFALYFAYAAMHPSTIRIGQTILKSDGLYTWSDDGTQSAYRADGLFTLDPTGFTEVRGSRWSMEPNTSSTTLTVPSVWFVLEGAPTTNTKPAAK